MNPFIPNPSDYILSQHLFIKFLGLSYLFAFWSLFVQVLGLYGSNGIISLKATLDFYKKNNPKTNLFFKIPTILWFNASDKILRIVSALGIIASLFVVAEIFPVIALIILWVLYLSFTSIGITFLSFQWDALLLEVGFIGIFFALITPVPIFLLVAIWFLLFRFMIASGAVKLLSGCPEWCHLKAMQLHYETQPIPNRVAYYLHQQPRWFSKVSEVSVYFFELVTPFLIFGTNEMRVIAFFLLVFFQFLIAVSGNYAFFNLLSFALCIPLLDNVSLQWLSGAYPYELTPHNKFVELSLNGVGIGLIILNILQLIRLFIHHPYVERFLQKIGPYYISNSYGLFAMMTTVRNEIIVEGSDDGENWLVYEFKWKPGDLKTPPKQVAPYHPRLDWQMWFAALGNYKQNGWFINFLERLLEGSHFVEKLLKTNPFPNKPPKMIRAQLYRYHFSDLDTKRKTGQWWTRTYVGEYTPVLTLQKNEDPFDGIEF